MTYTFLNLENITEITHLESEYWRKFFDRNLKVGVEIELEHDNRSQTSSLQTLLKPTDSMFRFGKSGVYKVTSDGSLQNGTEVATVGRRMDFVPLFHQYKFICNTMHEKGLYSNQRCGLHNHLLLSYNSSDYELEIPVPEIIFYNFMQLIRKHYPELVWITSTNHNPTGAITRYNYFCTHKTLMVTSFVNKTLRDYINAVRNSNRYQAINLNSMKVHSETLRRGGSTNDIGSYHMELRFPDGSNYPAQIAAMNMLWKALHMKAIKLSEVGVISTSPGYERTKELCDEIRNNPTGSSYPDTDDRFSNPLSDESKNEIKDRAINLISELKNELDEFSYDVLNTLANKPVSVMRNEGKTYEEINEVLEEKFNVKYEDILVDDKELTKLIISREIRTESESEFIRLCAEKLGREASDIKNSLKVLSKNRSIYFDVELKTMVI